MSTDTVTPAATIPVYLSTGQFLEKHRCFTDAWLRSVLFNRETNGLNAAILQAGRKILINETAFFAWLSAQQGKGVA